MWRESWEIYVRMRRSHTSQRRYEPWVAHASRNRHIEDGSKLVRSITVGRNRI